MDNKQLIDYYYNNIKNNKNDAILSWRKIKKNKVNYFSLGFKYTFKYLFLNIKESIRYILHNIKLLIKYIKISIKFRKVKLKKFNIISNIETVDKIVNDKHSIARFGDGEFKWILGIKQNSFQKDSNELAKRLEEVLKNNDNKNLLIGINGTFNSFDECVFNAKSYWKEFLINNSDKLYELLPDIIYCDSNITRPYIDYKDKSKENIQAKFDNLKRIWDDRDVVIVEGEFTKLGVGNDLFDNCKSINRIICPATNAFDKYDEIVNAIRKQSKDKLILMSLGPTATVLAYDMSKEGYQCIDTGHVDIEYMWFLNGAKNKEEVEGKFVNEVSSKVEDITDETYINQIIARVE